MITGEFYVASTSRIEGWARSSEQDSDHLLVEIFIEGRLRASTIADMTRSDSFTQEGGPPAQGFSARFERPLTAAQLAGIEIVATALTGERTALVRRVAARPVKAARLPVSAEHRPTDTGKLPWPFPMPIGRGGQATPPGLQMAIVTERLGLRFFEGDGWIGSRGLHLPIRGFAVSRIGPPNDVVIEVKGVMSDGEVTGWIAEANLCGRLDGHRVLTGFAVRALGPRCKFVYAGRFASGDTTQRCRDGEIAVSQQAGDPLTAMQIRLERCDIG